MERQAGQVKTVSTGTGPSPALALTASTTTLSGSPAHPSLPLRPAYNFAANADSIGFGAKPTLQSMQNMPTATQALAGSNRDVVANRAAIRMANMSARDMLKAELAGATSVKPTSSPPSKPDLIPNAPIVSTTVDAEDEFPGLGNHDVSMDVSNDANPPLDDLDADAEGDPDPDSHPIINDTDMDQLHLGRQAEDRRSGR